MKKYLKLHLTIWGLIILLENLVYVEKWTDNGYWLLGAVNFTLVIGLFYASRYFANRFLINHEIIIGNIGKLIIPLLIVVAVYIAIRYAFDYFILYQGYEMKFRAYLFMQFRFSLYFILPAIIVAAYENKNILNAGLKKDRIALESTIDTLNLKVIHLNSITESKEATIRHMDDEIGELQFNAEMLSRDLDRLEATAKAKELQVAEQNLVIQANSEEIERLGKENEMLTTSKTELEQEISNRQNFIVVLKAELIAGMEDYKQLANDYAMKMDLYNDKLSRYRNLYGELGDEEEY